MAKVVAAFPAIVGLSTTRNIEPKLAVLETTFGRAGSVALLAQCPRLASYSLERLKGRLKILESQGNADKLASAITLPEEKFARRFS